MNSASLLIYRNKLHSYIAIIKDQNEKVKNKKQKPNTTSPV